MTQMLIVDSQQDVINGPSGRAVANAESISFRSGVDHFLVESPTCAKLICFVLNAGKHRKSF